MDSGIRGKIMGWGEEVRADAAAREAARVAEAEANRVAEARFGLLREEVLRPALREVVALMTDGGVGAIVEERPDRPDWIGIELQAFGTLWWVTFTLSERRVKVTNKVSVVGSRQVAAEAQFFTFDEVTRGSVQALVARWLEEVVRPGTPERLRRSHVG